MEARTETRKNALITGPIYKPLIRFMLPVMLASLL